MPQTAAESATGRIGVFFHIPKTAGTTMRKIIVRAYGEHEVFHTPNAPDALESWNQALPAIKQQARFISGHMYIDFIEELSRSNEHDCVTMLRDPVDRVVSAYYFHHRCPEMKVGRQIIERNLSLEACLDQLRPKGYDNVQTRRLCGIDRGKCTTPFGKVGQDHLKRAKENLERHFSVVGLTEKFDQSLLLFADRFGWRRPFYRRENVSTPRNGRNAIPLHIRKRIEKLNEVDREVYEFGRKLLTRQLKRRNRWFIMDVKLFQIRNRLAGQWQR